MQNPISIVPGKIDRLAQCYLEVRFSFIEERFINQKKNQVMG